jgi:MFS transporter, DHA3 family, macrolide efflux protein
MPAAVQFASGSCCAIGNCKGRREFDRLDMATTTRQLGLHEVLRIKAVRRLWIAQLVSVFGDFLVISAVLIHASFNLNASPTQITWIIICFLTPFALIGPIVGVFVDRWNIRRTMIASDLIRAMLVLLLVFADDLSLIYVTMFLLTTVSTFFVPAQIVAIRTLAPPEGLISANALMHQAMEMVRIVTPALAGVIVGWFGAGPCYLIDSVSFLISAAMISTLLIAREPAASTKDSRPINIVSNDLLASARFIFTRATLTFTILSMAAGVLALSCVGPLIAIYVRDELKSSEIVYGTINSLSAVGVIVGTLTISRFAQRRSKSHLILIGLFTMGEGILLMGALKNIPAAAVGLFSIGLGVAFVLTSGETVIQVQTPVDMVGRVSSSLWALMSIAQLPGLILSGSMVQQIGLTYVFYATAVMLVLMAILGCFNLPQERPESNTVTGS